MFKVECVVMGTCYELANGFIGLTMEKGFRDFTMPDVWGTASRMIVTTYATRGNSTQVW